jgi:PhnB protein
MKEVTTYLNFDGNCRQAMTYYGEVLGLDIQIMDYSQGDCPVTAGGENRVMHARLTTKAGVPVLMASDTPPGFPFKPGDNFSICVNGDTKEEIEKFFAGLSKGGKVITPLQDMFWGAHWGLLLDQFGIQWMFNFEYAKQA